MENRKKKRIIPIPYKEEPKGKDHKKNGKSNKINLNEENSEEDEVNIYKFISNYYITIDSK